MSQNSPTLQAAITKCDNMRPEITQNTVSSNFDEIRRDLATITNPTTVTPQNSRPARDDKKRIEEITKELASFQKKFETVSKCLLSIMEKFDELYNRMVNMDEAFNNSNRTYANVVNTPCENSTVRLERLEFMSSEEERKNRILQVTIKHPSINTENRDFENQLAGIFSNVLGMESHEVDTSLIAQRSNHPNCLMIKFSLKRFKNFLFAARKRARADPTKAENLRELFINEYLTSYNYKLLKNLKNEKRRRHDENLVNFRSVYSFEGRVFVKMNVSTNDAIHVKNPAILNEILNKLDNPGH